MIKIKENEYKGVIGVCGASIISDEIYKIALNLGKEIAKKNYILACGGLYGTMEAVCKGAKSEGGLTIGILPDSSSDYVNSYVDIIIPTGIGEARNFVLINTSDGIITIAGGSGTLIEISYAWRMQKPIVSLVNTGGWSSKLADKSIDITRDDKILVANNVIEAVTLIDSFF